MWTVGRWARPLGRPRVGSPRWPGDRAVQYARVEEANLHSPPRNSSCCLLSASKDSGSSSLGWPKAPHVRSAKLAERRRTRPSMTCSRTSIERRSIRHFAMRPSGSARRTHDDGPADRVPVEFGAPVGWADRTGTGTASSAAVEERTSAISCAIARRSTRFVARRHPTVARMAKSEGDPLQPSP